MKRLFLCLLAATVCASAQNPPAKTSPNQTSPATGASAPSQTFQWITPAAMAQNQEPNARKAMALIEQMINALGGKAYMTAQDMEQEGRTYSFYQGRPNSAGFPFWRFWKFPDKDRVELTRDRDVIYVNNGDNGYEITYRGTAAQEKQALEDYNRRRTHSLETVLRIWLQQPRTAFFYDGTAVAEQKAADQVTILNANNDSVTIFIDSRSHLPIKRTFTWRDPTDKLKNEDGEIWDNYRLVQGIMTPHIIFRSRNGDYTNQRFLTTVKYNVNLADSLFAAKVTYDPYKRSGPRQ